MWGTSSTRAEIYEGRNKATGREFAADSAMVWRLYIVREVARAHGDDVEGRSDMQETVFAVRLPRRNEVSSPEQHQSSSQENAWDKAPS